MNHTDTKKLLQSYETTALQQMDNFQGLFMSVCNLNAMVEKHPHCVDHGTVRALESILQTGNHKKQSKAYFLFREVAKTLIYIINTVPDQPLVKACLHILNTSIHGSSENRLRAIAEATGSLRFNINPCNLPKYDISDIPFLSFHDILKKINIQHCLNHEWFGRSLVSQIDSKRLLVIKLANWDDNLLHLNSENVIMDLLSSDFSTGLTFKIPEPLKFFDHFLFSIQKLPIPKPKAVSVQSNTIGIAFIADQDYFIYPNEKQNSLIIDETEFLEIISRNSSLLGELTGRGFVHTAPVPLFHNRVQQNRRGDGGLYEWDKGGRLDRWLESCRYPNFGKSGVRDFEHIELFNNNSYKLYKHIGSHILSLILVTGSFFRNIGKNNCTPDYTGKSGFDINGNIIDARVLFDKTFFHHVLVTILQNYYSGFTGKPLPHLPFDLRYLSERLIDEMGKDVHMEEIIRIADQNKMSDQEFNLYLKKNELSKDSTQYIKGEADIVSHTGPHLGGFNQKFPIPEITDLLATISALCITGKYEVDNNLDTIHLQ